MFVKKLFKQVLCNPWFNKWLDIWITSFDFDHLDYWWRRNEIRRKSRQRRTLYSTRSCAITKTGKYGRHFHLHVLANYFMALFLVCCQWGSLYQLFQECLKWILKFLKLETLKICYSVIYLPFISISLLAF